MEVGLRNEWLECGEWKMENGVLFGILGAFGCFYDRNQ
jgi:hypothetical protein